MLPGTLTAEGKERAYTLMHTQILHEHMHLHSLQENTHRPALCHIVSTGCMLHHHANHSFGNAWYRNSRWVLCQGLWFKTVQLFSVFVIRATMMGWVWAQAAPFKVSLTSWKQQTVLLWANTTMCLSPLSILSQLQSVKKEKPQAPS